MDELVRCMRAMLMLQLQTAQASAARGEGPAFKPELLLAEAGFAAREIASMLGKSPAAVAKAISRGRAARRADDAQESDDAPRDSAARDRGLLGSGSPADREGRKDA